MEKKKYMKPACEMAEFEVQGMLASSIDVDDTPGNNMTGCSNVDGGFSDIWGN